MRIILFGSICAVFLNIGASVAAPAEITVDHLFDICEASNVQSATTKGDALGWQRLDNAETEEWRTHFNAYNGGSVDVVGWRRDKADRTETLSFWVAVGPNAHKACAFSMTKPEGWLTALTERLGTPDNLEKNDAIENVVASWKRGALAYYFVQVGSSAVINIGSGK